MSDLSLKDFLRLRVRGNRIAVTRTVPCDLETPVSCFLKMAGSEPDAFLLESAEQEEKIGRYSLLGFNPAEKLCSVAGVLEHSVGKQVKKVEGNTDLCGYLERRIFEVKLANPEALPDFCGGWIGYLGYENVASFEPIKLTKKRGLSLPDGIFFLIQNFVIFDHFSKTLTLAAIMPAGKDKAEGARHYQHALNTLKDFERRLQRPLKPLKRKKESGRIHMKSNLTRAQFEQKVQRIKRYVLAGDCIQVVLSQRFKMPAIADDFQIYRALRSVNPSPHMFYFRSGKVRLIGSSPELLVKKNGKTAEVRPIAGTRPRGKTPSEDLLLEQQLKASKKEMAEHLMLVDLGRNDLGRVCRYKSVQVKNFAYVQRFSHVMHLVSDVSGELRAGQSAFDLLKATFPAGTVTGAPKIRAMQIIDELEPENRGPYAGCLGYFSFNRNMEMCLTIRTLVQDEKNLYLQAGAGIVQDSKPAMEYQETVNKAMALVKALERRGEFDAWA